MQWFIKGCPNLANRNYMNSKKLNARLKYFLVTAEIEVLAMRFAKI